MARIIIPTPLRKFSLNESIFTARGTTVSEAIHDLIGEYPELKPHLFDDTGKFRSFINIFVEEYDIRSLDHEKTRISEKSVISIVPAIAGGAA